MHVYILTIFPQTFPGSLQYSLAGRALYNNVWSYEIIDIREFGLTKHRNVDDLAYGGSGGMVMRADVLSAALDYVLLKGSASTIYYPSPRGYKFNQVVAHKIAKQKSIIILCGRFEGIDERIIEAYNVEEVSIGDYILSGGEIAALTILDCVIRLLPGVIANRQVLSSESFEDQGEFAGLLECPLYTRPAKWRDRQVPSVLLSGHHATISQWRKNQSILATKSRRPDLIEKDK